MRRYLAVGLVLLSLIVGVFWLLNSKSGGKAQTGWFAALFGTPIVFHGKVVDEVGLPVEGAKILFEPTDIMQGASRRIERTSDDRGLFSISGIHGSGLVVRVSADGYYSTAESNGNFGYAPGSGESDVGRTASQPGTFKLRKKGTAAQLIRLEKEIEFPSGGGPLCVELSTGEVGGKGGDLLWIEAEVVGERPANPNLPFNWKCRIAIPGGGLIVRKGEFDFEAPDQGYLSEEVVEMVTSNQNWMSQVQRDYFVKLPSGRFGRVTLAVSVGGYRFIDVHSLVNPNPEAKNLEFDSKSSIRIR